MVTMHVFLIFTIIFFLFALIYFILFMSQFHKIKEVENYQHKMFNRPLWYLFTGWFYGLAIPLTIITIVLYALIISNSVHSTSSAYAFLIIAIINYISIIVYLFWLTLGINSVCIVVAQGIIYFMDEEVPVDSIQGLDVTKMFKRVLYEVDGEAEYKKIITKKTFEFLKSL